MQITLGGSGNSNSTDVIMSNVLVPAPGAVALLGMAGLVGSRRRR
ncbi:MAG: PEP-CTERM sorting domain-containing protein [Planctomycetes bacterium]|nr:PEP-CTERM sorting domain-containing protein [Planctomycetota bacterium]